MHVLVVGGGIAGLWVAAKACDAGHTVEVVAKTELSDGNTRHAQGGVAAALSPDDSAEHHYTDTITAGAGLADPVAVRVLCEEGPARVRDLIRFGVAFDRDESGLQRALEAAHSRARVVHAGGDATGAAIEAALVASVRRRRVAVHEHTMLVDLVVEHGCVVGVRLIEASGHLVEVRADAVVLATGGSGCLYRHTTNPSVATGDGVAAAWRAGATVLDLEFTQFHPTALAAPGTPLLSEAVRGAGAVLRDRENTRFMLDVDPRAELAPRDIVARAVWRRTNEQGGEPVLLDATALGAEFLARRFPSLDAVCHAAGYAWGLEPVPVTPAAHYSMGGIATDLDGRTSLPGLWAIGETARTGVHGANRLASNSLLEAAVFADRAARSLNMADRNEVGPHELGPNQVGHDASDRPLGHDGRARVDRAELQRVMWEHVGLERSADGLAEAFARLEEWRAPVVRDPAPQRIATCSTSPDSPSPPRSPAPIAWGHTSAQMTRRAQTRPRALWPRTPQRMPQNERPPDDDPPS